MAELQFAFDVLVPFIMTGVIVGVFLGVVFAIIRIGWTYAWWIAGGALIYYFLEATSKYPFL